MEAGDTLRSRLVSVGGRTYRDLSAGPTDALPQRPSTRQRLQPAAEPNSSDTDSLVPEATASQAPAGGDGPGPGPWWNGRQEGQGACAAPEAAASGEDDASIVQEGSGGFVSKLSCDAKVFPFLIGSQGLKKKALEKQTGTVLDFPRRDASGRQLDNVTLRGPSRQAVASAKTALKKEFKALLESDKKLLDFTHFVSLPLTGDRLVGQYKEYMAKVLADPNTAAARITAQMFTQPQQLHLTLQMLKLYSEEARDKAKEALASLAGPIRSLLDGKPLEVKLAGLSTFSPDTSAANVLYFQVQDVHPGGRMQRLCELVGKAFRSAGLVAPQDDRPVKLHATLLNTSHIRNGNGEKGRVTFDCTELLRQQASADLGVHGIEAMHVSQRSKYDDQTGYYWALSTLALR